MRLPAIRLVAATAILGVFANAGFAQEAYDPGNGYRYGPLPGNSPFVDPDVEVRADTPLSYPMPRTALPRVGQEVIVDFLQGDVDHPVITGRLYNSEQAPPYVVPR